MRGADQLAARAARADRDALDSLRPMREHERVAGERLADAAGELFDAGRLGADGLPGRPRRTARRAPPRGRRRAGRCCRSRDARRAPGGTPRGSGRRRRAPRAVHAGGGRSRRARSARTCRDGRSRAGRLRPPLARRARARTRRRTRSSSPRRRRATCRPGVPYSGNRWISRSSFAYLMISSRWAMSSIIATLCPLGVWRSLVARSVRVGEVRSSNLRTPMSVGEPPGSPTNLLPSHGLPVGRTVPSLGG